MSRPLPPLGPLRAFEATIRLGSMTRAAEELSRTHGAISRQIAHLEAELGVTLFEREAQGLRPTAAGAAFHTGVVQAFDALEKVTARIAVRGKAGHVRYACGSTFASRWLVPRLPRFYETHPGITLSLVMIGRTIAETQDYDVATSWDRLGYPVPEGPNTVAIGDVEYLAVARPEEIVRRTGQQVRIGTLIRTDSSATDTWAHYAAALGLTLEVERTMAFPHIHLAIEACIGGLGVALVERRLVEQELMRGELVVPLPPLHFRGGLVALYNPQSGPPTAAMRRFVGWLKDEIAVTVP
jgi:DNA-binding transcriptional LysR family regulator